MNIEEAETPEQQAQVWAMLADLDWGAQQKTLEAHRGMVFRFMEPGWPLLFFDEALEAMRLEAMRYACSPGTTVANVARCRAWMTTFFDELLIAAKEATLVRQAWGASTVFAAG